MSSFKENSAGYLANHLARLFAMSLSKRIQPLGLAPAQFMVLLELWEDDGKTQTDLVMALDVEQATMANTLSRMERDGLITRRPSKTDRRAKEIYLTDHARTLEKPAKRAAAELNASALQSLDKTAQRQFFTSISAVIDSLQRTR